MLALTALFATLLFSVSAVANLPTPTTGPASLVINPATSVISPLSQLTPLPNTNAARLARGLPPRSPNFNRPRAARPSPSFNAFNAFATRSAVSRRAAHKVLAPRASAVPCAARDGTVRVVGDGIDGFVLAAPNVFGEFGYTSDVTEALKVRIGCGGEALDIATLNGIPAFPFLGAVRGYAATPDSSALQSGTRDYAYLAGTAQTAPHTSPAPAPNAFSAATGIVEAAVSALWMEGAPVGGINPEEMVLSAVWDVDGPVLTVLLAQADNVLLLAADADVFRAAFGEGVPVTLTFVEG